MEILKVSNKSKHHFQMNGTNLIFELLFVEEIVWESTLFIKDEQLFLIDEFFKILFKPFKA